MALFPKAPGGGQEVAQGYKGKGVLLHVVTDKNGLPVAIDSTGANGNEREISKKLFRSLRESGLAEEHAFIEADKGYDSAALRADLINLKYLPLIAWRKFKATQSRPSTKEMLNLFNIESQRWKIERFFAHLKTKFRRLMDRWERLQSSWLCFCKLALIAYWIF